MLTLIAAILFLPRLVSCTQRHTHTGCAHGWVSSEPLNLKTKVSCSKLEKVEIPIKSEEVFEVCAAACLEDDNCIGLETDKPWKSCYKVLNRDVSECTQGNSLIYPKVCGTCTVHNIASLDINAVPGNCANSSSDKSLTLIAGTSCTLGCCKDYFQTPLDSRPAHLFLNSYTQGSRRNYFCAQFES